MYTRVFVNPVWVHYCSVLRGEKHAPYAGGDPLSLFELALVIDIWEILFHFRELIIIFVERYITCFIMLDVINPKSYRISFANVKLIIYKSSRFH